MVRTPSQLFLYPLQNQHFWSGKHGHPWSEGSLDVDCSLETKGNPCGTSSNIINSCKAPQTVPRTEMLAIAVFQLGSRVVLEE